MFRGNFRLHELQAAFLRVKLRHLDQSLKKRRENAQKLIQLLQEKWKAVFPAEQCTCEGEQQGVRSFQDDTLLMPFSCQSGEWGHTWNQFVIRITGEGRRDVFKGKLSKNGIQTEIYYPRSVHEQKCFQSIRISHPIAERLARQTLALPLHEAFISSIQPL